MVVPDLREWTVTSFYRFIPIAEGRIAGIQSALDACMKENRLLGLVLIANEGINGSVAGEPEAVEVFKRTACAEIGTTDVRFKDSVSTVRPFRDQRVERRAEIVGLKRPDLAPESPENNHLSPAEWHEFLNSGQPKVLIDTRNSYETRAGKFKGAIDPGLKQFSDWEDYLDNADLPKDTPVLIYCTGGIRCEKAILAMHDRGFDKVYQLRDGILGYLAEYPEGHYEGECFVFDNRVTVGPNLQPTGNYGICPGCGLTAEKVATCVRCGKSYFICEECEPNRGPVCSKPCLDHWQRHGV